MYTGSKGSLKHSTELVETFVYTVDYDCRRAPVVVYDYEK